MKPDPNCGHWEEIEDDSGNVYCYICGYIFDTGKPENTMQKYNGWTNWETWNVNMWLCNEESHYFAVMTNPISADEIETYVRSEFIFNAAFGDITSTDELNNVNWDEIYAAAVE